MSAIVVRGAATPLELAAVLAVVLAATPSGTQPGGYDSWRAGRLRAVRRERREDAKFAAV